MSKGTSVVDNTRADDEVKASDATTSDSADSSAESDTTAVSEADARSVTKFADRPIRLKSILTLLLIAVVAGAGVFLLWQLRSTSSELDRIEQSQADQAKAEQISLDYATGAAEMNFQDPEQWRGRLTAGTTPELSTRLEQAATSMEQLIQPLQWTSTATPVAAKVESVTDGVYQVVTFVNVLTKNTQTPDGIESTATYKTSIDSKNGWMITEISGMDTAIDPAAQPK